LAAIGDDALLRIDDVWQVLLAVWIVQLRVAGPDAVHQRKLTLRHVLELVCQFEEPKRVLDHVVQRSPCEGAGFGGAEIGFAASA
jgi:hypothetical protein